MWATRLLTAWVCVAGAWAHAAPDALDLVGQRLGLMREVAAHKWRNDLSIEDLEREATVIHNAAETALRHGLEVSTTRELFRTQISAAKEIQTYWFERWALDGPPASAPDLNAVIRPRLLVLGEQILVELASQGCCRGDAGAALAVEGLGADSRERLLRSLASVHRYPSRLQQVLQSGVLRIGTTGDYAPFSYRAADHERYVGIDIDLVGDLAASLGVQARFVATSWPTLMDDLQAGRYDIAMSGVSRTLARQRMGYFTRAYHVGGKTPISRCDDRSRFGSLQSIDREDVRIVVNPGGSNERFVDERLTHARKLVHQDNRSIFRVIAEGDADVMITDRIEVTLQTDIHRGVLCATMAENLTYQEKAYLLPQDDAWRSYVDAWLNQKRRDGELGRAFSRHLGPKRESSP
ncbi:MAG: gamma subclass chorismate mutase AroQ [Gammaproteobacteria bacterium]|nr:gamma subclass chorismate mutase AroQ [Gammaproteobacteria bacterium]